MSYPKQKNTMKEIKTDKKKFSRTARQTKKCNVDPRIMRGGIRL